MNELVRNNRELKGLKPNSRLMERTELNVWRVDDSSGSSNKILKLIERRSLELDGWKFSDNVHIGKWTRRFFEDDERGGQIGGKATCEGYHEIDGRILAFLPAGGEGDYALWKNEVSAVKKVTPQSVFGVSG